jgi:hypothetical protein
MMGDWILEIGDWGSETNNSWNAEIIVGNADPRPGVPIRIFEFGFNGNY